MARTVRGMRPCCPQKVAICRIRAVICDNRDNHVSKEMILQKLVRLFEISREEAEKYYDRAVQKEAKNCYNQVNEKD